MGRHGEAAAQVRIADRVYGDGDFYVFSAFHRWAAGWVSWLAGDPRWTRAALMALRVQRLHAMRAWPVLAQLLPDLIEVRTIGGELSAADRGGDDDGGSVDRSPDPFTGLHRAYARGVLERARGKSGAASRTFRSAADAAGVDRRAPHRGAGRRASRRGADRQPNASRR